MEGEATSNVALIWSASVLLVEFAGIAHAAHAVSVSRSPEGAIAWALSLIFCPWLAIPLYWVIGRSKFDDYAEAMRQAIEENRKALEHALERIHSCASSEVTALDRQTQKLFESLARTPFTDFNKAGLLIDGEATFKAIFEAIEGARSYVLVEYYIFRDDMIGREFKDMLVKKAREGVTVHFIYDEIGSGSLPECFLDQMRDAGIGVSEFGAPRRGWAHLRLNFRNHRKIVVVDGHAAFIGGLNVGDEYLSRSRKSGYWRDTHLKLEGPAALAVQLSFLADLNWASGGCSAPNLDWEPKRMEGGAESVLIAPTGPADKTEPCSLLFIEAMNCARKRLWLATPYFVPDDAIVKALQLAARRGVDVRIMMPERTDSWLVDFASLSYLEELSEPNIRVLRYLKGFLHHKAMLVDEKFASIGTANMDNRSFRLNFEICALVSGEGFIRQVAEMFERDMASCRTLRADDYLRKNFMFRVAAQTARLLSPLL